MTAKSATYTLLFTVDKKDSPKTMREEIKLSTGGRDVDIDESIVYDSWSL